MLNRDNPGKTGITGHPNGERGSLGRQRTPAARTEVLTGRFRFETLVGLSTLQHPLLRSEEGSRPYGRLARLCKSGLGEWRGGTMGPISTLLLKSFNYFTKTPSSLVSLKTLLGNPAHRSPSSCPHKAFHRVHSKYKGWPV